MKHRRKVDGEQMITLQIAQQLKTKIINFKAEQLFCRLWKAKFLLKTQTHRIDGNDKVQFVTDTDNEFTEYQTARKKLQSIGISPVSLHALPQHSQITDVKLKLDKVMNTIKSDISKDTKYTLTVWKIQSLILMVKVTCKRKRISWLGYMRQFKNN